MNTTAATTLPALSPRRRAPLAGLLLAALGLASLPAGPAAAHLAIIRQGAESRGVIESGDRHGAALAAGDFNGDGYDDLATAAPSEDISSALNCGAVVVNYGSHFGLTHAGAGLLQESDFGANSINDDFGTALAAGDFNHDGYDDLAVGAPGADLGLGSEDIGAVYLYNGGPSGLTNYIDLTQGDAGGSHEAGDRFGAALCVGDFNGDGTADLGIGSPGEDAGAGTAFWFCGGAFGLATGPSGWLKQSSLGGVNTAADAFGASVAAGNVFSTSHDDLIIGTPYKDFSGLTNAGAVYVVAGSAGGINAATRRVYDASTGDLGGRQTGGFFGYSVAAGHFYTGSWDGLAVGEPGRNASVSVTQSGRVVVGKGGSADVDWVGAERIVLAQTTAGQGVSSGEQFGLALAAGEFDTHDGYDDLAIGSPKDKSAGTLTDSGWAGLVFGSAAGPTGASFLNYYQSTGNDPVEPNDEFGFALCLGDFDGTNRGNLAIGAPGEDGDSGMAHIIAPWRQNLASAYRTQYVEDCEGHPVFTSKAFDEVCIASTTKTMTVLIACERSQLPPGDPKYVSLDATYTVPDWIRDHIGGSLYGFEKQETLTLRDLLRACIFPSGNDAAYAIADMLTGANNGWLGSYGNTCPVFVAEMNQRAAQLGMTHTLFTNPAGLDVGNHHSSAYDMALLGRAAIQNGRMAQVVGSTSYKFYRTWKNDSNTTIGGWNTIYYGYLQKLQARNPDFCGVKPGSTPCADVTGVMAATGSTGGKAIATVFGYDVDLPRTGFYDEAAALMKLGIDECGSNFVVQSPGNGWGWALGNLSTALGNQDGGGSAFPDWEARLPAAAVELYRLGGAGATAADFSVLRSSEAYFDPSATQTFGIAPFEISDRIVFDNLATTTAHFRVTTSLGGTYDFTLAANERGIVPCVRQPNTPAFTFAVLNLSGGAAAIPMSLGIQESYTFPLTGIGTGNAPVFSAQLRRPAGLRSDGFRVRVFGKDPNPGQMLYAAVHDPGTVSEVTPAPPVPDGGQGTATLLSAAPNPFDRAVTLRFALRAAGALELALFDVQGRRVTSHVEPHAMAGTWEWAWDGRDAAGRRTTPGVYFYRLSWNGRPQVAGRVSRIP